MIGRPKIRVFGEIESAKKYIEWARVKWNSIVGRRYFKFDNCIIEIFNWKERGYIAFYVTSASGLVFLPRSGSLVNSAFYYGSKEEVDYTPVINGVSWKPENDGFTELPFETRDNVFPSVFGTENAGTYNPARNSFKFIGSLSNYGNFYWISADKSQVVSWRGTPTRHFRDSYKSYYETFSQYLFVSGQPINLPTYSEGEGDYVLGASKPNGSLYMIGYHRMNPSQIILSKKVAGEWVKLLVLDSVGYDGLPWLPDESGLRFIHNSGAYLEIENDIPTFTQAQEYIGQQEEQDDLSFSKSFSGKTFFDYGNTTQVSASVVFSQSVSTSYQGDGEQTEQNFQISAEAIHFDGGYVDGDQYIQVGSVYTLQGTPDTYCSIEWSVGGATFDQVGDGIIITSRTGCGTQPVTATLVGGGNDGKSFTKNVLFPSGVWVFDFCEKVGDYTGDCNPAWPPYSPCYCTKTYITNGAQIKEYWQMQSAGIEGCSGYYPCGNGYVDRFSENFDECVSDGGFTGSCCNCVKHNFNIHYKWVCP